MHLALWARCLLLPSSSCQHQRQRMDHLGRFEDGIALRSTMRGGKTSTIGNPWPEVETGAGGGVPAEHAQRLAHGYMSMPGPALSGIVALSSSGAPMPVSTTSRPRLNVHRAAFGQGFAVFAAQCFGQLSDIAGSEGPEFHHDRARRWGSRGPSKAVLPLAYCTA